MKKLLCIAALALAAGPALAQVSIDVGVPGVFGRIDIGGYPPPQVYNPQPVYIQRGRGAEPPPIYLHVPPDHKRRWSRYCGQYNACGQPVYFVQDNWYRNVYTPQYQQRRHGGDGRPGNGRDDRGGPRGDDHRGRDDHRGGDDRRGGDDGRGRDGRGNGR